MPLPLDPPAPLARPALRPESASTCRLPRRRPPSRPARRDSTAIGGCQFRCCVPQSTLPLHQAVSDLLRLSITGALMLCGGRCVKCKVKLATNMQRPTAPHPASSTELRVPTHDLLLPAHAQAF